MHNVEIKLCLTLSLCKQFRFYTQNLSNKIKAKSACRLAAKNLVHKILSLHKQNAGNFLKHVREVTSLNINNKMDFGKPLHSVHSEPFYYETAYLYCFQPTRLIIDKKCLSVQNVVPDSDEFVNSEPIPVDPQGKAHISDSK